MGDVEDVDEGPESAGEEEEGVLDMEVEGWGGVEAVDGVKGEGHDKWVWRKRIDVERMMRFEFLRYAVGAVGVRFPFIFESLLGLFKFR